MEVEIFALETLLVFTTLVSRIGSPCGKVMDGSLTALEGQTAVLDLPVETSTSNVWVRCSEFTPREKVSEKE